MKYLKRLLAAALVMTLLTSLCACSQKEEAGDSEQSDETRAYIEETLNLANNDTQKWTYNADSDAWTLSVVSAVAYPELADYQGVSVCVPGAYVVGIDTDKDGSTDVSASDASEAVQGALIIDYEAEITSSNGQIYTAETAPVVLNTGAAGYGSQSNQTASATHAADGYINVVCGNRGKQSTATDDDGNTYYTGDAPSCLVDQKAAARFVKYNILLGNLPGNVDYFVSTGGSGGGAHAAMFAATSNNPDYYDYQIEAGAVGVYRNEDGTYSTTVSINGTDYELSDGAWGCIAYSPITSLYEADMTLAFEYCLNTEYSFNTPFQAQVAEYLSETYMEYINTQNLSVEEQAVGFDLNADGDMEDVIALSIEYDLAEHPETNGYYGTYLDLYLAEFTENLQWYVDNLDYSEGWTWFQEDGTAMADDEVAAMTSEDRVSAFIEGRYTKGSSDGKDGMDGIGGMDGERPADLEDGEMPDGMGDEQKPDGMNGELPDGAMPGNDITDSLEGDGEGIEELPDGGKGGMGQMPGGTKGELPDGELPGDIGDGGMVGTPEGGTTQSATGTVDSANYATYEDMVEAYKADIEEVVAGDEYGNNIVSLYNPLSYIGAEGTEDATWVKLIMGASEGDLSMFNSLNLQIAMLNAGVDAVIEWQWNGGHVPSEVLGDSFSLYLDQMYGEYVSGAVSITKQNAAAQTTNGTSEAATGTDIRDWVSVNGTAVSFSLADAAAYRTAGASKAIPGFDVIDYGQEDYVFGDSEQDARHWNTFLLDIFEEYADVLEPLFNANEE